MSWLGFRPTFAGGVHPGDEKQLTADLPLERMPDPDMLLVPVQQHAGRPAQPLVKKGDWVREGQELAAAAEGISAAVLAPRGGQVQAVVSGATASGFPGSIVLIKPGRPSGSDEVGPQDVSPIILPPIDPRVATADEIVARVGAAGIVGQGGAAFPTAVKLKPPGGTRLDVLIINGCECEPYLTRDYRLMLEETDALLEGAELAARALGVSRVVIGVEDNKANATEALEEALARREQVPALRLEVLSVRTKYPQGAEKMLIEAITKRRVPPGKLPMSVGAAVQNVGTVIALREAVVAGRVQTEAVLTVSGRGIQRPANLRVPVGTPIADVLDYCGGLLPEAARVIVGGPMMGVAQHDLSAPVVKACSGILVLSREELGPERATGVCLRCGKCVEACPIHLVPSRLARLAELERVGEARDLGIEVCMECGTCAFACPAHLPLVQWLRLGKQQARTLARSAS